jgi:colanic acid biosynthesis glycosyl transferase WcaI
MSLRDERNHLRILFISQYFPPEMAAGGVRVSELARHWTEQGHDVTVVTGVPNYPDGVVPHEYRLRRWRPIFEEQYGDVRVVRAWLLARPNKSLVDRGLNYTSFCLSSCITGLLNATPTPDVVIATSPPLFVPIAGAWISYWKHVPWVFDVRDLWPESLTAVGAGNDGSLLHQSLSRLAVSLYRSCNRVVIVSPAFKNHLVTRCEVDPDKISVVVNGVDEGAFTPADGNGEVRNEFGVNGKFVLSYLGTVGMAQGLHTLIEAAVLLEQRSPNAIFLVVGGGAEAERLEAEIRDRNLKNVRFFGVQPRHRIPDLIRASDACLVMLKKSEIFKTVIPTKLLEAMACGRPVIAGVEGHARTIIEKAQCGIAIEPENPSALAQAAGLLSSNPEMCKAWGMNGRQHILEHYTRKRTAARYLEVLREMSGLPGDPAPVTNEEESQILRDAA